MEAVDHVCYLDDGERRKRLTTDISNDIVRDIVSSMYAFMTQQGVLRSSRKTIGAEIYFYVSATLHVGISILCTLICIGSL